MSLFGSLNIGVAGLAANSAALSATSSNIANVNTVGYKEATTNFSTFLNSTGLSGGASAGVTAVIGQDVTNQGLPITTSSPTDLSISGNGFFVVSPSTSSAVLEYTRAGSFTPDTDGNLVNAAGLYLRGWALDSQGKIPTDTGNLSLINVSSVLGKAQATDHLGVQANLQASDAIVGPYTAGDMAAGTVTPEFQRTINVYDSQGGSQPLTFSFVKTAANTWNYEVTYSGDPSNVSTTGSLYSGTMSFNSDSSLANADTAITPATGTIALTIPWSASTGLAPQTISINLGSVGGTGGVTQYDSTSIMNASTVNGSPFGSVTGVTVAKDGTVTAQFSNGLSQDVYKIPVATFANPDGLAQVSGNAYIANKASGAANINVANSGSAGGIASQSLEGSTVDLAAEFTNLITTQRAYSASARIITTVDQMLQQLEQLPTS
ncbi:MAG TPA: flagellar hook protein FlgE [Rhizomicrobium sp.]|jgi:flagellar hook protein FlgE|nr:flagellar hook protein FlgE [Rhizomicrobium sp.]